MDMMGRTSSKIIILLLAVLLMGVGCVSDAAASAPADTMTAHLWITGLPDGQLVPVTIEGHAQLCYCGGEGCYDFVLTGQPGEIIRALIDGREVQSFAFEPGAPVYLSLTYANGTINAVPYEQGMPIPTPYAASTAAPESRTEHTSLNLGGSWIFVIATLMSLVVVGCFAMIRRKR